MTCSVSPVGDDSWRGHSEGPALVQLFSRQLPGLHARCGPGARGISQRLPWSGRMDSPAQVSRPLQQTGGGGESRDEGRQHCPAGLAAVGLPPCAPQAEGREGSREGTWHPLAHRHQHLLPGGWQRHPRGRGSADVCVCIWTPAFLRRRSGPWAEPPRAVTGWGCPRTLPFLGVSSSLWPLGEVLLPQDGHLLVN